jgi:nucleoside phosphorylase
VLWHINCDVCVITKSLARILLKHSSREHLSEGPMDTLFQFLSSNPTVTVTLLVVLGGLILAIILIYIIAFAQGRPISFWPPKIGERPTNQKIPKVIDNPARPAPFPSGSEQQSTSCFITATELAALKPIEDVINDSNDLFVAGVALGVVQRHRPHLLKQLEEGVRQRFMVLDPDSPDINTIARVLEISPEQIRDDIQDTLRDLEVLRNKAKTIPSSSVEVRLLSREPAFSFVISDPKGPDAYFTAGLRVYGERAKTRPYFVLRSSDKWFRPLVESCEKLWADSQPVGSIKTTSQRAGVVAYRSKADGHAHAGDVVTNQPMTSIQPAVPSSSAIAPSSSTPDTQPNNILIVTATKIEAQAVLEVFSLAAGKAWIRQPIGNKTYYNLGVHGGLPVFMVQSEMGTATPGGALLTVRQAIQDLRPQAVIMCGIAFGLRRDKQQLGDILIAKQLQYYEPQKVDIRRGQMPRGDRTTSSERLLDRFRSGDNDWQGAQTHFGVILSGEKLVNKPAFRDWLLKTEPEAIGGEMEGAGLYAAARDAKMDWILVKAICDWADGTKNDDTQPLAARNAAQFVLHVLQLGDRNEAEQLPEVLVITARTNPKKWIFPVGAINSGETLQQAAARECEEESGYIVEVGPELGVIPSDFDKSTMTFFLGRIIGEKSFYETDRQRKWVRLSELPHVVTEDFVPIANAAIAKLADRTIR